ncbi:MAG: hypothetical protein AABZ12_07105 [Planctomycetota bacterium]
MMRRFFRQPLDDVLACLEKLAATKSPGLMMAGWMLVGVATWFVYVPIHELLHAAGCVVSGGAISKLEIQARYGGAILANFFPFVVTGGEYAGRLSGFDTRGNDLIYLATDFGPFLLTVLLGVPLLKVAGRSYRPILFPMAVVVGLAPFYNLQGDYYEMGSTVVTRTVTLMSGRSGTPIFEKLRSDDIFKLFEDFFVRPAELGVTNGGSFVGGFTIILASLIVGIVLAFLTYFLGHAASRLIVRGKAASGS